MNNIQEQVINKMADYLMLDKNTITPESRLIEDLYIDSIQYMMLFMELETEFNLIDLEAVGKPISTVQDVINIIQENIQNDKFQSM